MVRVLCLDAFSDGGRRGRSRRAETRTAAEPNPLNSRLLSSAVAGVIRFCLALWVGGTLVVVLSAPVVFRRIASRDTAGEVFGEILRRFEAVKHVLSLLLVLAVFFQLERTGGFAGQSVVAGIAILIAVASNLYP